MWITPPSSPAFDISFIPRVQKIVGGNYASPGEFPYQLQLKGPLGVHSCGAVLITTLIALTAAHCVYDKNKSQIKVVSGQHLREQIDGTEQSRDIREIIAHANYNPWTLTDDIALLVLDKEFLISDQVNTAILPNETTKPRDFAVVSGWGRIKETEGTLGAALKKTSVPIIPLEVCRRKYSGDTLLDTVMCAGSLDRDACDGDSGGPLTCTAESGVRYVCGIVSWARGCGREEYPTIYTNVGMYNTWIEEKISRLRTKNLCPTDSNRCTLNYKSSHPEEGNHPCSSDEFHCSNNNKCIPLAFRCDEELDCGEGDHSDELGCPGGTVAPISSNKNVTQISCTQEEFQCVRSKRCIPLSFKCDTEHDCGSGDTSDEENCGVHT